MKKLAALLCLFCGTCFAYDKRLPVWEQLDKLVCEGVVNYSCDMKAKCGKINSTALWEVDFKNAEVVYLNSTSREKIIGRYFKYYEELSTANNVIFIQGRLMSFIGESNKDEFIAVTSGVTGFPAVSTPK
jgi:hypothetical protein